MNRKHRTVSLLALILACTLFLACAAAEEASGLPITQEPVTLTYAMVFSAYASTHMNDLNEMPAYQELERRTGVHIEFELISPASQAEQFTLMMASNDLPDMIHWNWGSYPGGGLKALEENQVVDLTGYIADLAPNLSQIFEDNPEVVNMVSTPDGRFFCFPYLHLDSSMNVYGGPAMRQDWLDAFDLAMPETVEEWYTVLKTFKENDANGNGVDDEIPFLPTTGINATTGGGMFPYSVLASAWDIDLSFYQVDGVVKYGYYEPAYLDFLTEMNKWYNEGLIDQDVAATDNKLFEAKVTGDQVGAFIGLMGGQVNKFNSIFAQENPGAYYMPAPYPVLNKGDVSKIGQYRLPFANMGTVITTSCENVEVAAKWLDYQYSEEGNRLMYYGVEGESYNMVDGQPILIDEIVSGERGFTVELAKYAMGSIGGPFVQDPWGFRQANQNDPIAMACLETWTLPEYPYLLPSLSYTDEETEQRSAIQLDMTKYINQMLAKFIMGVEPLSNFDAYLDNLRTYGVEELIASTQAALERYNAK